MTKTDQLFVVVTSALVLACGGTGVGSGGGSGGTLLPGGGGAAGCADNPTANRTGNYAGTTATTNRYGWWFRGSINHYIGAAQPEL